VHHPKPTTATATATLLTWRPLAAVLLACSAGALAGPTGPTGPTRSPGPTGSPAAAVLADPTRPPAALLASPALRGAVQAASGAAASVLGARSLAAAAALPVPVPVPASVLQSLQLPIHGPAVAMVDGRLVKAGDTLGTRTVLSIDSQGLVLRGDGGSERLTLLAGPAKQAPGSITTTSNTRFVAASTLDADPLAQTERSPPGLSQPPAGGTLSLVGRIKP
jgi:hypothetical protein